MLPIYIFLLTGIHYSRTTKKKQPCSIKLLAADTTLLHILIFFYCTSTVRRPRECQKVFPCPLSSLDPNFHWCFAPYWPQPPRSPTAPPPTVTALDGSTTLIPGWSRSRRRPHYTVLEERQKEAQGRGHKEAGGRAEGVCIAQYFSPNFFSQAVHGDVAPP